jgi:hypothetical protein
MAKEFLVLRKDLRHNIDGRDATRSCDFARWSRVTSSPQTQLPFSSSLQILASLSTEISALPFRLCYHQDLYLRPLLGLHDPRGKSEQAAPRRGWTGLTSGFR